MIGCLRRAGCLLLALLVGLGAAAWFTRDRWLSRTPFGPRARPAAAAVWESPSDAGARRADSAIARMRGRGGPAYATVSAGDLMAYVLRDLSRALPPSADSLQAAVIGERLYVRLSVRTADLGREALGPLASLLRARERVQLGGTLRIVRPGLSELLVQEVVLGELRLPDAIIPALVRQLAGANRPAGIAEAGVPLVTPEYIGDVRVARGRVTLYKGP